MATMEELYQQYLLTQPVIGGSQNRYRDLMSQMRPFSNPYPAATGLLAGGTVAPAVPKTPAKTSPMGTYGGGGGGTGSGGMTNSTWDSMTDAQKASYYANNPTMAGITQFGQSVFGNTSLGRLQGLFAPGFVADQGLIAMGVDPQAYQAAKETFRQSEINAMNRAAEAEAAAAQQAADNAAAESAIGSYGGGSFAEQQAINNAIAAAAAPSRGPTDAERQQALSFAMGNFQTNQAAQQSADNAAAEAAIGSYGGGSLAEQQAINDAISADNAAAEAAIGSYGGGSFAEQAAMNDAIAAAAADAGGYGGGYDSGGYGTGDSSGFGGGTDSGSDGWAKGGKVTKNRLKGPDPRGPDEGYGALLGGEFVIKKSSVKKYGEGLLSMINDGKIPAKKLKSLLG